MNNFEIVIHPFALTEINDIATWYFVRSRQAELQFHYKLDTTIAKLVNNPSSFSRLKKNSSIRSCMIEKYPYKIYYRVQGHIIEVLAIIHISRSNRYILRRLK